MKPCVTCNKAGKLTLCDSCMERAESMLHAPVPWTPFVQAEVVHDDLRAEGFQTCFKNSRYTVWVRRPRHEDGELVHLSVKRNDRNPLHDWRDLQRIKNEILGPEEEAVELYPAESRLVDGANQFHLWSFVGKRVPFGYQTRCVMLEATDGAKQRPYENPPADALTEEQFQEKATEYKALMEQKSACMAAIRVILGAASERPCDRRTRDDKTCADVPDNLVPNHCGPCMARAIDALDKKGAGIL